MTDDVIREASKEKIATYLYFLTIYAVTVGALYLWGFWSTFNVNILEYMSLSDIIKSTIYPIGYASFFLGVGISIGLTGDSLPPGGGRDTRTGKFLNKSLPVILPLYAAGTVALIIFGPITKWYVLPGLIGCPLCFIAGERGLFNQVIRHEKYRAIFSMMIILLPIYAYGEGRMNADSIKTGKNYDYVESTTEGTNIAPNAIPAQRLRLLGHAGEFIFLLQPSDEAIVMTKLEPSKALVLKHLSK